MARRPQWTELDEAVWAEWNRLCFGKDSFNPGRQPTKEEYAAYVRLSVPHWDSFVWDAFVWDGTGLTPTDVDETGTAENIRITISSGTNYIASYTVNSVIHHYSLRRGMRV